VDIQQKLTEDMKTSMKAGDVERTGVLRLLRGAIKNEELKTGQGFKLDEAGVLKVLQREAKQRKDSIQAYAEAGRDDLKLVEEKELAIIVTYLPEAMSEAEVKAEIDVVMDELGDTDMSQMGQVIGSVMKRVGGRADGGMVSKLVRERLSS
jgi:uncharacterized protein